MMPSLFPRRTLSRAAVVSGLAAVCAIGVFAVTTPFAAPRAAVIPAAPAGVTAVALDGAVDLAWQPSADATGYTVYRGTSAGSITTVVSPGGLATPHFTDTTATNGVDYFYVVRATSAAGASPDSQIVQAKARQRSCTTGNAIVVENCFPGTTDWKTPNATRAYDNGIEGFASAPSVAAGESVDLKVRTNLPDSPYHVEIYRTGGYAGDQGRLISQIRGLSAAYQPVCEEESTTTGVTDCSTWSTSTTVTTSASWPSGVYILKLVRDDNDAANEILLVVRDDASTSDIVYQVPTTTYQAYNAYGKTFYDWNSGGPDTVAGTSRAVKVSDDRPNSTPAASPSFRYDWYTRTDVAAVSWLESQGYDVTYVANQDVDAHGALLQAHDVAISGVHDEYWSQGMRDAWQSARDAGVSLVFLGANAAYWRVRFEASSVSGRPGRVMVGYKTIQGGPADPSGHPTTTFRDPAINQPENALLGAQYIGDNSSYDFPLRVSAAEAANRLWRYTSVYGATGSTAIGTGIVGWEWDARADNGLEPAGVTTLASSAVNGNLVQANGASYTQGPATQNTTFYRAASGALVFATGTNRWARGLALDANGAGEPDARIKQLTANVLTDAGVRPATPASGLEIDPPGDPAVASTVPANGAGGVLPTVTVKSTFDRELDPATVGAGDMTLEAADGTPVAGEVTLSADHKTISFDPVEALEPFTSYTATVATTVKAWSGTSPSSPTTFTFVSGPGTPPAIISRGPATGAAGVSTDASVTARFDRRLDAATVTAANVTLAPTAGGAAVPAQVTYDSATKTIKLQPNARLAQSTVYTVTLAADIQATDGTPLAGPESWTFTTGTNVTVTSRTPAAGAAGMSPATSVVAVLSRAADPTTVTATAFTLRGPGGTLVPASVSYAGATRTARLLPASPLALSTTYTAEITTALRGADGAPTEPTTWTFTTAASPPPAPAVTGVAPAAGSGSVFNGTTVRASLDIPIDPATVSLSSFTLRPSAGGDPVAASVSYDAPTNRVILTPSSPLAIGTQFEARLTTDIRTTTGAPLAADVVWTFTTAQCPCSLFNAAASPADKQLSVSAYRTPGLTAPFTYELGTKVKVDAPTTLVALRYYKDVLETGSHIGRVWDETGALLAQATYASETTSGWQRQSLATPLTLQPGHTYTVSVNVNTSYGMTQFGMSQGYASGPLSTVSGNNGSYNDHAGQAPNTSFNSSNYYVDAVVRVPSAPQRTPEVVSTSPAATATGVAINAKPSATFNYPLDPGTVTAANALLLDGNGNTVAAAVAYDDENQKVTLTPSQSLETGATYSVRLETGIKSDDETPLAAAVTWSFSTVAPTPPVVVSTSPASGAPNQTTFTKVTATFDQAMDAGTLTDASVTLAPQAGGSPLAASVSYSAATRTVTLTPSAPLAASTSYTATLATSIESSRHLGLVAPVTWTFTTSACPCQLFNTPITPANTNLSTANGRSGAGPYSLEMGVKVQVTEPARIEAIRYYRDANETGSHTGRVWTANGTLLTSTTFTSESASGWQEQALAAPLELTPGQVYMVSVGINSRFVMTGGSALGGGITSGPLASVVDGRNGAYSDAAGVFPNQSWFNSNYFIDAVVR
jgi:hypothetical protein